jgi:chemotaxis protein MotB
MMTSLMIFFLILWAYTQFHGPSSPPTEARDPAIRTQIKEDLGAVGLVDVTARKITVTLPSAVLFDPGRADLKEGAKAPLRAVAQALARSTAPVVVEGHTDDAPIRASRWRSNYELSAARAFSVIQFLTADHGFSAERLSARGYGPNRPAAPNASDEARARNRRIEIHLLES